MTLAFTIGDAAFATPPHRPSRSERRSRGNVVTALLRSVRRELARGADDPATSWLPKLSRYPY
ncbi:MAG TPA: hypothetical protein VF364_09390 [Candidatus Limnocylindria bacterium]